MTSCGECYNCGTLTGWYDETKKRWDCGCSGTRLYGDTKDIPVSRPVKSGPVAPKYAKLLRTGRWSLIEKTDSAGTAYPVGVRRKSTGEDQFHMTHRDFTVAIDHAGDMMAYLSPELFRVWKKTKKKKNKGST